MTLHCNVISHWLDTSTKCSLNLVVGTLCVVYTPTWTLPTYPASWGCQRPIIPNHPATPLTGTHKSGIWRCQAPSHSRSWTRSGIMQNGCDTMIPSGHRASSVYQPPDLKTTLLLFLWQRTLKLCPPNISTRQALKFQIECSCPSGKWIVEITCPNVPFTCLKYIKPMQLMWKSDIRSRLSDKSCRYSTCPTVIFCSSQTIGRMKFWTLHGSCRCPGTHWCQGICNPHVVYSHYLLKTMLKDC